MRYTATYKKHTLQFIRPAGTSRGVYHSKVSYFLFLGGMENQSPGIGECNILRGLSIDDVPHYEEKLAEVCAAINTGTAPRDIDLNDFPSIAFALETALLDMQSGGNRILFPSEFTNGNEGIITNGLIWMGSEKEMQQRIEEKLNQGFHTIKMKIGAISWDNEHKLLQSIRKHFDSSKITLRVDANGAFDENNVFGVMEDLAKLDIHSIEQPVDKGNHKLMAEVIHNCEVPVALDEELIGISKAEEKQQLLQFLKPAFLILKPSLLGGLKQCEEWIEIAHEHDAAWWATSALESNIGLNAIAQWTVPLMHASANHASTNRHLSPRHASMLPQGLGLGNLYHNNIPSPITLKGEKMYYDTSKSWNLSILND